MTTYPNLLTIVQTACDELGLVRPSVVVNSSDLQIRQIFACVNRELRELQQNYDWTALQTEYDLYVGQPITTTGNTTLAGYQVTGIPSTTGIVAGLWVCNAQNIPVAARVLSVDSSSQVTLSEPATATATGVSCVFAQDTYPEPQDFDRFINQTWWDRTNRWALMGPDSPQIDQWHRSGVVTIGPRRHFRQIGYNNFQFEPSDFNNDFNADFNSQTSVGVNNYRLWPPPGATDTPINLVFEYISSNCVLSISGAPQPNFQADTDVPLLDPNMLILGAKWRFWQIKGFDYAAMQAEYRDYVDRKYANDGGAKTLSMASLRDRFLINSGQTPDGSWPGPTVSGT